MKERVRKPSIARGLLVGLIGGLVASWAMNRFQDVWLAVSPSDSSSEKESDREDPDSASDQDDATVKTASAVSEALFNHKLTPAEKRFAGPAVHYAVGAGGGMVYGIASEFMPQVTTVLGLPYGTAFWLIVDETIVPLLGLAKGPTKYPLSTHAYAFASHLLYGATIEGTRRMFRD